MGRCEVAKRCIAKVHTQPSKDRHRDQRAVTICGVQRIAELVFDGVDASGNARGHNNATGFGTGCFQNRHRIARVLRHGFGQYSQCRGREGGGQAVDCVIRHDFACGAAQQGVHGRRGIVVVLRNNIGRGVRDCAKLDAGPARRATVGCPRVAVDEFSFDEGVEFIGGVVVKARFIRLVFPIKRVAHLCRIHRDRVRSGGKGGQGRGVEERGHRRIGERAHHIRRIIARAAAVDIRLLDNDTVNPALVNGQTLRVGRCGRAILDQPQTVGDVCVVLWRHARLKRGVQLKRGCIVDARDLHDDIDRVAVDIGCHVVEQEDV